jgi:hypothetical protein
MTLAELKMFLNTLPDDLEVKVCGWYDPMTGKPVILPCKIENIAVRSDGQGFIVFAAEPL